MDYTLFILSAAFHLVSVYLFLGKRYKSALFLLFFSDIVLRYWFAHLDPFLHDWDEIFHALVAKNTSHHWLIPTLIDQPLLDYSPTSWTGTHVWLHKQPEFLWQMAASIKLFGVNLFAVRLPSIILGSLLIYLIYDIAKKCFDPEVAYVAAFLFSFYQPILELNSGSSGMDHNTMAFFFFATLSIWAWIRFEKHQTFKWAILMGIAAGLAVLNKWLTGLLVFGGFGFYHLFYAKDLFRSNILMFLLAGLGATLVVFLPWQIYTLIRFPVEARYELNYNSLHFSQVVEGHQGETWYYINYLKIHYKMLHSLIFIGFAFAISDHRKNALAISLIAMCFMVYGFFTLAATKLNEYVLLVAPLLLIFISLAIVRVSRMISGRYMQPVIPTLVFTVIASWLFIDIRYIRDTHSFSSNQWVVNYRTRKTAEMAAINQLIPVLQKDDVVINCPDLSSFAVMFYTDNTAYGMVDENQKEALRRKGKHLVIFPAYK